MRHAIPPLWVCAVRQGSFVTAFCLVVGISGGLTRDRVLLAFAVGAVLGPLFGLGDRRAARRERENLLAAVPELGSLDRNRQAAAQRAARRGPVPDDDQVRLVAVEVARYRLVRSVDTRTASVIFAVLLFLWQLAVALFLTPWGWVGVVFLAAVGAHTVLAPRWRSARVVALEGDLTAPMPAGS